MNIDKEIAYSLRYLLIPIPPNQEDTCLTLTKDILSEEKISVSDMPDFIKLKFEEWRADGNINSTLKKLITEILKVSDDIHGAVISKEYFNIHTRLLGRPLFSFEESIILLNQIRLIAFLAERERMSSAKIAVILKAIDSRLNVVSWREVRLILTRIKLQPTITPTEAESLYLLDEESQDDLLADADILDASFTVGEVAKQLRFKGDLELLLNALTQQGNTHVPYLQILHYVSLTSGFFDHVASALYEFGPRGNMANWLFSKWDKLTSTSNPFLNNAKAVDVLDKNWANSRSANEYAQAHALVEILQGLDEMGLAASQELAAWIRRFLIRYIKINETDILPIPPLTAEQAIEVSRKIFLKPTSTFGILEQRIVDVYATTALPKELGWRSRGLGDSVNANNLSKKKLGDCDFQNINKLNIKAFESHGGVLSSVYFEGHMRTFIRALQGRAAELKGIADLSEWEIEINFVAYDFTVELPEPAIIEGVEVTIHFIRFSDLPAIGDEQSEAYLQNFNSLLVENINSRKTPQFVRDQLRALINTPETD